ncbi:MAG TPA: HNH endonuclease signature motif containing protein [Candidatus Paceibacterota bacterium]|jgi:5-methylcytosine-specific restriction endonuclease McrA|nr:HNH endonuclease signature motif containing protein [Candidatus Paceibacterota bacterium]
MPDRRKYADRREALIRAVSKRRKKIKSLAIEYKGGKCQICGYNKYQGALELHHIKKEEKGFGIGDKGYTRSWDKVKAELDKCILLCANCHREVGAGIMQLPSESLVENEVNSGNPTCVGNPEPSPLTKTQSKS